MVRLRFAFYSMKLAKGVLFLGIFLIALIPLSAQVEGATAYISPNLDGVQDTLILPLTIRDERYIKSYALTIRSAAGIVVRTIRNKETRPETADFGNLVDRFFRLKEGLKLPKVLVWDGKADDGSIVRDGLYNYQVEASDDNNNLARTDPRPVLVDTKYPVLTVDAPQTAFAPGGDRPSLTINHTCDQSLAPIDKWDAGIFDVQGHLVRSWTYHAKLPAQTVWDGRNNNGILAADGIYTFRLATSNRAGNRTTGELPNLQLINQATPLSLTLDNAWFSPNGDGIKDQVIVGISGNDQVALTNWVARLKSTNGLILKTWRGSGSLPRNLVVTGLDESAKPYVEGNYQVVLEALYINGNKPTGISPVITLKLTKPTITVLPDYILFSPNGDGFKDTIALHQKASPEPVWEGRIVTGDTTKPRLIRTWQWRNQPDADLVWDGRDQSGTIVEDGQYAYQVQATDLAGNRGSSIPVVIQADKRPVSATIRTGHPAFAPGTTSSLQTMDFMTGQSLVDGVMNWRIRIFAIPVAAGKIAAVWSGTGRPPATVSWDGKTIDGSVAPDGSYQAEYKLEYSKGDQPMAWSGIFVLDTQKPEVMVETENPFFSPDGDGKQDFLIIKQKTSDEDEWQGTIFDSRNQAVKNYHWRGKVPEILNWDGSDSAGNKLPDGEYSYELSARDLAGNQASARLDGIKINTAIPEISLTISTPAFSPNGDGDKDVVEFVPHLNQVADVKSWKLLIKPAKGGSARTVVGTDSVPAKLFWDGKTDGGRLAPEGDYQAVLTILYKSGQNPTVTSPKVTLDITPPNISVFADPTLFSPNGDSFKDISKIAQDTSKDAVWKGIIRFASGTGDPGEQVIRSFTWLGRPPRVFAWDGTNNQGATVPDGRYVYQLSARDLAGNSAASAPIEIRVDNRPTPLAIKPAQPWFSPLANGKPAKLQLLTELELSEGIESWSMEIRTQTGVMVRLFKGSANPPGILEWDGRNDAGGMVPDGDYQAVLTVVYLKGDRPTVSSDIFSVDSRPPEISLSMEDSLFSPDGDTLKDVVRIRQKSSNEAVWEGSLFNSGGILVRSFYWKGNAQDFVWDGRDDNGNLLPDGVYRYVASATDKAGNSGKAELKGITIDTRPTPLLLVADNKGFAPGASRLGLKSIAFKPIVTMVDGIDRWTLNLVNQSENSAIEKSFSGTGLPPPVLNWDGYKDDQTIARDGRYIAVLTVEYRKGNRPEARSPDFVVNRGGPQAQIGISPRPFSPDDDGENDEVTINMAIQDLSPIRDWKLEILDPLGSHFATFGGQGAPSSKIVWNGRSDSGELAQSLLDYPVILTLTDSLLNRNVFKDSLSIDVLVLRDGENLRIRIPGFNFPANSAELFSGSLEQDKVDQNTNFLGRISEILRKFGTYQITVESHVNSTQGQDPKIGAITKDDLQVLTEKRAAAVRDALIKSGIAPNRLTANGMGASQALVPASDPVNIWKNRRIEFILRK